MGRRKKTEESDELKDARARFREMEGHAQRWAEQGAPLHVMASAVAALGSIAGEITKLERRNPSS